MALTIEEVTHVARLARLRLSDAELEKMRAQMSQILGHFDMLAELDTREVPPTAQVTGLENVLRADEPQPSLTPDEALANAPQRRDTMFRVRAVFDE